MNFPKLLAGAMLFSMIVCGGAKSQAQSTERATDDPTTVFFTTHPEPVQVMEKENKLLFANRETGLEFVQNDGDIRLSRLYGISGKQDYLTGANSGASIFQIMMTLDPKYVGTDERNGTKSGDMVILDQMAGKSFSIDSKAAKSVTWRQEKTSSAVTLHFDWKEIDVQEDKGALDVEVTVTLREGDPLSAWRIAIHNRSARYGIERVRFPLMTFAPIGQSEDDTFLLPRYRGELMDNPFRVRNVEVFYPYSINMQFQALYDKRSGNGVYMGTHDPAANFTCLELFHRPTEISWRLAHFPANITFSEEDYTMPYDCVVGPFQGDWFDACQMYRQWAVQQPWCRKGPLATRTDIPRWFKEAPLYFFTFLTDSAEGTHSQDENIAVAAAHFREFVKWTGMKLPATWYGWKEYRKGLTTYDVPFNRWRSRSSGRWAGMPSENAHDGNYPAIPALHSLSDTCKQLRREGGMVCPYVCLKIFDQGPSENAPYAAAAKPNMIRDLYGNLRTWGIETVWQPCAWTPWWRDRLTETCVQLQKRENASGVYLDTMQGMSLPCYWTPHGHSAGGADSMSRASHGMVEQIRRAMKAEDPNSIMTGENSTETMIDVIDGVLTWTLGPENTAPIFATVYRDYITRHGTSLSHRTDNDDFYIEAASLFVEGAQIGRIRLRPRSDSLSFQKPQQKPLFDFLGQLVGYYRQESTRRFIAYGRLMRPLKFDTPSPMPMLTWNTEGRFPALMSGVFRTHSGELGVFVVNAGGTALAFGSEINLTDYEIPAGTAVNLDTIAPDGKIQPLQQRVKDKLSLSSTLPARSATMFRISPANLRGLPSHT